MIPRPNILLESSGVGRCPAVQAASPRCNGAVGHQFSVSARKLTKPVLHPGDWPTSDARRAAFSQSAESIMGTLHFARGRTTQQVLDDFNRDPKEPWCSDLPAPPVLSTAQQIALLTLRHSDQGNQVLAALYARGEKRAGRSDYESLVALGLADRDRNGYHSISPNGQWRAREIAREIARQLGIVLTPYTTRRRSRYSRMPGMSDAGNA